MAWLILECLFYFDDFDDKIAKSSRLLVLDFAIFNGNYVNVSRQNFKESLNEGVG
jgi:hypothetical protein